jgi:hypothetical protein
MHMQIINNYVTKILSNDANNSFSILTYLDIGKELCPVFVLNYMNAIVDDNPILKHDIVKNGDHFYLKKNNNFNVEDHVVIKHVETDDDHDHDAIHSILNKPLVPNTFLLVCCINTVKKVTRIYFKINHAYTDGYGLINMLTKPIFKRDHIPAFKRTTSLMKTMYHCIIGTLVLFVMNVKLFFKIFTRKRNRAEEQPPQPPQPPQQTPPDAATEFIVCKPFMLDKIKKMAVKHGITVNDFLYSLMIKTDRLYTKNVRNINTCSPINVSSLSSTNNMAPILNCIDNSLDGLDLVKQVNRTFNHFKYSLFIPLFSCMINAFVPWINFDAVSFLYDEIIHNCDYVYSNVIGPPIKEVNESNVHLTNIHFLTKSKGNSIVFNIISCENKINMICSFNANKIKNKKRFEKCIYRAYNELITALDLN